MATHPPPYLLIGYLYKRDCLFSRSETNCLVKGIQGGWHSAERSTWEAGSRSDECPNTVSPGTCMPHLHMCRCQLVLSVSRQTRYLS